MSLANIALALETAGQGTRGKTIFVGIEPSDVGEGLLLRVSDGPIDPDLPDLGRLSFQLLARALTYPAAEDLALAAIHALRLRQRAVGDAWFYECNARHVPIPAGKDTAGVYSFIVNFDATWRAL